MKISIIGFGAFGELMAKHLSTRAEVFVTDKIDKRKKAEIAGARFVDLNQALKNEIIILAVPMQEFQAIVEEIKDKIIPGTIILDVCSLKMFSCNIMNDLISKDVDIIGTHPLFGPNSAKNGINGKKIVLVDVRTSRLDKVKEFCESLGLEVIVCTAQEHDKQMAISQVLPHLVGRTLKNMQLNKPTLSTKTSDNLFEIIDLVGNDSIILFNNIQNMNPFAEKIRNSFALELNKILEGLK